MGASRARETEGSEEPAAAAHASGAQRIAEVQMLLDDGADPRGLASAIAEWASEPDALPARRMALEALRGAEPKALRLDALRSAAASSEALEKDPLASEMISATTEALELKDFPAARDMMIAESNARARELLASSLAKYVSSDRGMAELSPADMTGIRSDFIDVYANLPEMQRKDVVAAVEKIAGGQAGQLLRDIPPAP